MSFRPSCAWVPANGNHFYPQLFLWLAAFPLIAWIATPALAADLTEVKIGYYGPADPAHPVGGALWQGASLAIEEANAAGGYRGIPYRFVPDWDENPWTGGAAVVARLIYQERVWAILGGIDGGSTHLAEQVVAKARLPLMDPASTDRSVNAAFVPWAFSVMPDDRTLMRAVVADLERRLQGAAYVLVRATGHDARMTAEAFESLADRRHLRLARFFEFATRSPHLPEVARQAAGAGADTVVVVAGAADSAAMVLELRAANPGLTIYGGPTMGRRTFLEQAGEAAEAVRFPLTIETAPAARGFLKRFTARYGVEPDYSACHAYDAATLLVTAIRKAGLDRTKIRDTIEQLSPWNGVSGVIRWDQIRRNARPAVLATILNGRVKPLAQPHPSHPRRQPVGQVP